ncbi:MAG: hypothetical protein KDD43_13870 [Bdellovibrionales bacterium]|nr:hypothetical protein [Bdellovibrionales bacterium]
MKQQLIQAGVLLLTATAVVGLILGCHQENIGFKGQSHQFKGTAYESAQRVAALPPEIRRLFRPQQFLSSTHRSRLISE